MIASLRPFTSVDFLPAESWPPVVLPVALSIRWQPWGPIGLISRSRAVRIRGQLPDEYQARTVGGRRPPEGEVIRGETVACQRWQSVTAGRDRLLSHADRVSGSTGPTFLENVHADRQGCKLRALAVAVGTETTSVVPQRVARPPTALGRGPQSKGLLVSMPRSYFFARRKSVRRCPSKTDRSWSTF